MEIMDREQIYHILQNLSNLEISYTDYSKDKIDYDEYQTYFDYFDNYVIQSHNLSRFYFPVPDSLDKTKYASNISKMGVITDQLTIPVGFDISISKLFNFPSNVTHSCDYYSLLYLMEGNLRLTIEDNTYDVVPGDFYLLPPNIPYAATAQPESIGIFLDMRKSFLNSNYKLLFQEDSRLETFFMNTLAENTHVSHLLIHTQNTSSQKNRILDIFLEYINQNSYSNSAMKNLFSLLMIDILRDSKTEILSSTPIRSGEYLYRDILEYINHNYQTASLKELADSVHFSKQYICKIVKQYSGDTFQNLLIQTRLKMVENYLVDSKLSIETIAELCGFSTAAHLSRCFKNKYGISPTKYRKEL